MVAADPGVARNATAAAAERARTAVEGVPEETRGATEDGTTEYLRPLPGAARMYPETDVPPVELHPEAVETPELLTEKVERYVADYGLDSDVAEQVAYGRLWRLFEDALSRGVDPNLAARTVESTVTSLRRDGVPVGELATEHFHGVFELVAGDEVAQEGVPDLLAALAESPDLTASEAAEALGLGSADEDAVREAVVEVVERNAEQRAGRGGGNGGLLRADGRVHGRAPGEGGR